MKTNGKDLPGSSGGGFIMLCNPLMVGSAALGVGDGAGARNGVAEG